MGRSLLVLLLVVGILFTWEASAGSGKGDDHQGFASLPAISQAARQELEQMVDLLLEKWPAGEYVYIGLGRSPALITASIKNRASDEVAANIPLSQFKCFTFVNLDAVRPVYHLQDTHKSCLYRHFDEFLGHLPADKPWLLLDFVSTGATLFSAEYFLKHYRNLRGHTGSMVTVGIGGAFFDTKSLTRRGIHCLMPALPPNLFAALEGSDEGKFLMTGSFSAALHDEVFKDYAEYASFHYLKTPVSRFDELRPRRAERREAFQRVRSILQQPSAHEPLPAELLETWHHYPPSPKVISPPHPDR
ncbi:hypothetical protein [Parendozoicomonas haliclonae]|uniref:Uncharacterized protein n=1 Tax=Parendozoicomonas haliclonae TaxID=1960125 RepID=A0A1X7ATE6_9GAMM|nr:hypothetical protein [Parendozoicomonas haliclonae]SMA50687.1 hypothetical protein EHSB41UT_04504 [Parendozoicomonas haliclonae]